MIKQSGILLGSIALAFAMAVGLQTSLAQEYYFGNFEEDVQFNGQYVLDRGTPGDPEDPPAEGYAGWFNWRFPADSPEILTASPGTIGATTGDSSIAWQPTSPGYHQGLAVTIQSLPTDTRGGFFDAFFANTHIAMNVTWDSDEWFLQYSGDGWNGASVGMAFNYGPTGAYSDQEFPDIDSGNPTNQGFWDLTNYPETHNRIVQWDYSAIKPAVQALYTAGTLTETAGWLEFMLYTNKGEFALPVTFYVDSWRLTSLETPGLDGDYNENDEIDAADYTVWRDAMTAGSTTLPNDPTPGTVDEDDFIYWRDNFGATLGTGAGSGSAAVPEPSSVLLALLALGVIGPVRRLKSR